jgi:hypothetical protein
MISTIQAGGVLKPATWARSLLCLSLLAGMAYSQAANTNPAARTHVKQVGTQYFKFTSKLTKIVELNFTFGNGHQPGKAIIATALDRIASTYGGITVQHFRQGTDGATGQQPNFTVDDLLSGQVIVANNVSMFGSSSMGSAKQQAIQKAIETDGRGYLGFHGSGDNEQSGWSWFTNTLHPMNYKGHGARTEGPVYKHLAEAKHVVLDGILETKTTNATVPNEVENGNEVLAQNVPTRKMRNEWYKFGRQIADDPAYKDKVTILLKYDPRNLGSALETQYRRKGGNMFTYLYKVGAGLTSYMPPGHENDELLDPNTGFDGGSGDFDRYVGQLLFFLAGYNTTACDASCNGLPLLNAQNQITGTYQPTLIENPKAVFAASKIVFGSRNPTFSSPFQGKYEARLLDTRGRVVESKRGEGVAYHEFNTRGLLPGVYVLSVKVGNRPAQSKRYVL